MKVFMEKVRLFSFFVSVLCTMIPVNSNYAGNYNPKKVKIGFVRSTDQLPERTVIVPKSKFDLSEYTALTGSVKNVFREWYTLNSNQSLDRESKTKVIFGIYLECLEKIGREKQSGILSNRCAIDNKPLFCCTADYVGNSVQDVIAEGYQSIAYPLVKQSDIEHFTQMMEQAYPRDMLPATEFDLPICTVYGIIPTRSVSWSLISVKNNVIERLKPVTIAKTKQLLLLLEASGLSRDVIISDIMPFCGIIMHPSDY